MKAKTVTTRCWAEASPSAPAPAVAPTAKPRRLSPFGSISLRETALAGHRPHRGRCFAVPVTAAPRRGPAGKIPALVGLKSPSISPAAKPRVRSLAPQGPACSLPQTHFFVCGPLARIPKSHIPAVTHRSQPHLPAFGIELVQLP